jgi:hypothetical protein
MIPLTPAQRGFWFIHQSVPDSSMLTIQLGWRLTGHLNREAIERAVGDVVQRHEPLRTVFRDSEDGPYQVVLDRADRPVEFECRDITSDELAAAVDEACGRPFDLSRGLPFRAWLFVLGDQEHVLLLSMHHIVSDGQSLGPLIRDLTAAYAARCQGQAPSLPPLPVRYADYVLWQRLLLGDEEDPNSLGARQLAYWRSTLDGMPDELRLPVGRPRPPTADFASGMVAVTISAAVHAQLAALARSEQVTMFMVLQAGFAVLLTALGAGTDLPIGSPVAGRVDEAMQGLVGCFTNTLVLRTDTSGDPSFRELVKRVQWADLDAMDHQDLPFERLVESLDPELKPGRHPLFQVRFAVQENAAEGLGLPGLEVDTVDIGSDSTPFDLMLVLTENFGSAGEPIGIDVFLEYRRDLFNRETAQGFAESFSRVLTSLVGDPNAPISMASVEHL